MSKNDILYRHLRDVIKVGDVECNIPYATLAMYYDDKSSTAYVAGSICSPEDNFSYKRGREIAEYRLNALISGKVPKQLVGIYKDVVDFEDAENILHNLDIVGLLSEENNLPIYKLTTSKL